MLKFYGVNISGAEFGSVEAKPASSLTAAVPFGGVLNKSHTYLTGKHFAYWVSTKKLNILRYPIKWERLQPVLGGPLSGELKWLKQAVADAGFYGATVLIDVHNYGRRSVPNADGTSTSHMIDGPDGVVTRAHFSDFWGKLAAEFKGNDLCAFDLMNEVHDQAYADGVSQSVGVARMYQAAIDAIRAAGCTNAIHVEPASWAKPSALVGDAGTELLKLRDPLNKIVFHVHQYLDSGEQGDEGSLSGGDVMFGVKKITAVTDWARRNKVTLFLGEFGIPPSTPGYTAIGNLLSYMETNSDVWTGFTAWGAGDWWAGGYHYRLNSVNGVDDLDLVALKGHIPSSDGIPTTEYVAEIERLNALLAAATVQALQLTAERDAALTTIAETQAELSAVSKAGAAAMNERDTMKAALKAFFELA